MFAETTEIEDLAILASCYRAEFETRAEELLARLETLDPDFVRCAVKAFGDRRDTALWMLWSNKLFGGVSPLFAVARGQRESVLKFSAG